MISSYLRLAKVYNSDGIPVLGGLLQARHDMQSYHGLYNENVCTFEGVHPSNRVPQFYFAESYSALRSYVQSNSVKFVCSV